MRKTQLIWLLGFFLAVTAKAQVPPNLFNYSAVARNGNGQAIASSTIGIQISILKSSVTGSAEYIENHTVTTDAFGLFKLLIGNGIPQNGDMEAIDWSTADFYLKIAMDATGGTNFLNMGTVQLLSVPYTQYAKSAGTAKMIGGFTHFIGEQFGGGVIFHLWKDELGAEHGLIVDTADLNTNQNWSNKYITLTVSERQTYWDGLSNSNAIVAQTGHQMSAASLCLNSTNGGQSDWYLPAIDELVLLWHNRFGVNKTLSSIPSATPLPLIENYWSSTSLTANSAMVMLFLEGSILNYPKVNGYAVRAIRAF